MTSCCCGDWIAGLAREHAGRLASIARREGVGPADALDVVQDAFLALLARPDVETLKTRPADAARVLGAIVKNAARNLRRRHHHARPHIELDEEALPVTEGAPDRALDRSETMTQLATCMTALGDAHRAVITLRVLEELSGDEAARTLGITPGHVATLLHRARKELERCMTA